MMDAGEDLQASLKRRSELLDELYFLEMRIKELDALEIQELFAALAGWTNKKIADELGVSPGTVGHWRVGRFKLYLHSAPRRKLRLLARRAKGKVGAGKNDPDVSAAVGWMPSRGNLPAALKRS